MDGGSEGVHRVADKGEETTRFSLSRNWWFPRTLDYKRDMISHMRNSFIYFSHFFSLNKTLY